MLTSGFDGTPRARAAERSPFSVVARVSFLAASSLQSG